MNFFYSFQNYQGRCMTPNFDAHGFNESVHVVKVLKRRTFKISSIIYSSRDKNANQYYTYVKSQMQTSPMNSRPKQRPGSLNSFKQ